MVQAPDPDFWRTYRNRRACNHVSLMLTAQSALVVAIESGDTRLADQLRDAINEYRDIQRSLAAYVTRHDSAEVSA